MGRRTVRILIVNLLLAGVLVGAAPAAGAVDTGFTGVDTLCANLDPGRSQVVGNFLKVRDQVDVRIISTDEPRITGPAVTHTDLVMVDLLTGSGWGIGTFVAYPDAVDGTWVGEFRFRFDPVSAFVEARGVGTGELAGLTSHFTISYPYDPGVPPPCEPLDNQGLVIGSIDHD